MNKKLIYFSWFLFLLAIPLSGTESDHSKKLLKILFECLSKTMKENNIDTTSTIFDNLENIKTSNFFHNGKLLFQFNIDARLKFDQSTEIFYRLVDPIIEQINSHPDLSDLFSFYPIQYKDLGVVLCFDGFNKGYLKDNEVYSIEIKDDKLVYKIMDSEPNPKKAAWKTITPDVYIMLNKSQYRTIIKDLPKTSPRKPNPPKKAF